MTGLPATGRALVVGLAKSGRAAALLLAREGWQVVATDRADVDAPELIAAGVEVRAPSDEAVPADMVVFGEIGLGGEVRPVSQREARLREAAKLGFRSALVPRGRTGTGPPPRAAASKAAAEAISIDEIEHLSDLVARFQPPADRPSKRTRRDGPADRGRGE